MNDELKVRMAKSKFIKEISETSPYYKWPILCFLSKVRNLLQKNAFTPLKWISKGTGRISFIWI